MKMNWKEMISKGTFYQITRDESSPLLNTFMMPYPNDHYFNIFSFWRVRYLAIYLKVLKKKNDRKDAFKN